MIDWELNNIYHITGGAGAEAFNAVTIVWKLLLDQIYNALQKYSHLILIVFNISIISDFKALHLLLELPVASPLINVLLASVASMSL